MTEKTIKSPAKTRKKASALPKALQESFKNSTATKGVYLSETGQWYMTENDAERYFGKGKFKFVENPNHIKNKE